MTDEPAGIPEPATSADAPIDSTPSAGAHPQPAGEPAARVDRDRVTVRRSPRYGRFIILGAGLGAIVTFVLTNLFPTDDTVGFGALFGYFLLFGVPVGAAIGGLVAVLLERIVSRRSAELEVERVEDADVTIAGADPDEIETEEPRRGDE